MSLIRQQLTPNHVLPFPPSPFMDFAPWHMRAIEPDFLMGRKGVAGWNGENHNVGLWIPGLSPDPPGFWESLDWTSGWTWLAVGAGVVVMIVGGWVIYISGSLPATALGIGLITVGAVGGYVGATTGNFWGAAGTGVIVGAATALTLASGISRSGLSV